jgi:hypothetical protein
VESQKQTVEIYAVGLRIIHMYHPLNPLKSEVSILYGLTKIKKLTVEFVKVFEGHLYAQVSNTL